MKKWAYEYDEEKMRFCRTSLVGEASGKFGMSHRSRCQAVCEGGLRRKEGKSTQNLGNFFDLVFLSNLSLINMMQLFCAH